MKTNYTKGTWEVAKGGRSVNVGRTAKCRFEAGLPAEELAANCALIAAAPRLLEYACASLQAMGDDESEVPTEEMRAEGMRDLGALAERLAVSRIRNATRRELRALVVAAGVELPP